MDDKIRTLYENFQPEQLLEVSQMMVMVIGMDALDDRAKLQYWMARLVGTYNKEYPTCMPLTAMVHFSLAMAVNEVDTMHAEEMLKEVEDGQ